MAIVHDVGTRGGQQDDFNTASHEDGNIRVRNTVGNPEARGGHAKNTEREGVDVGTLLRPQEVHEDEAGEHGEPNGDVGEL
jgi:hypothetical protein